MPLVSRALTPPSLLNLKTEFVAGSSPPATFFRKSAIDC